jgi:N-methylhydantoinase A/oxoprolinase/acetone carboxylase beta subunit
MVKGYQGFGMLIGLDAGGTHTDVIVLGKDGPVNKAKVTTDPADLFKTIINGLEAVMDGIDPDLIRRMVLSTTLATNLVIQKKLPPVAMVVAAGPGIDPRHFATNSDFHVVQGAMDHRGREIAPLDREHINTIGLSLKSKGIEYVGVVSKFSVRNPEHEKAIADWLSPHVRQVFMGHQYSGSLNFPRRIATTYLNAAVSPVHNAFFQAVKKSLDEKGFSMPIRILKPDGGSMNLESSLAHPAQTIMSGPSASVMGALAHAPADEVCLVLDIGGTTTDMAVLIDGAPLLAPQGIEISGFKTLIRALQSRSIGIGGDSLVRLNNGKLHIGPDRLGCAMAYGGPSPTPTDAFTVLGMADDGDRVQAEKGIAPIATALGLSVEDAADKIFDKACRTILDNAKEMVEAINSKPVYTIHELHEGIFVKPRRLLVLGGPAPQFATRLKTMFPGKVEVIPHWQVANAVGCALARSTCEVTLFADTALQLATAPGEHFTRSISPFFELDDAIDLALKLLRKKALRSGAKKRSLEMEIIESSSFNMIREFNTIGKNIRVRAQVKPGLVKVA